MFQQELMAEYPRPPEDMDEFFKGERLFDNLRAFQKRGMREMRYVEGAPWVMLREKEPFDILACVGCKEVVPYTPKFRRDIHEQLEDFARKHFNCGK